MAAGMQAGIGNVAAGSLFATAQSVGMGGALLPAATTAIGVGVAGLGSAVVGAASVSTSVVFMSMGGKDLSKINNGSE